MYRKEYDPTKNMEESALFRELKEYSANGCALRLNGRLSRPEQISKICVRENSSYMRDIVTDESQQHIREINFVRIRNT